MKKVRFFAALAALAIVLTGCAVESASSSAPFSEAPAPPPAIVFSDAQLEEKIREAIAKPEGDITEADAAAVKVLDLSNQSFDDMNSKDGGVRDISALRYFTGLTELNLSFNDITDLSPLAGLTKLESLGLTGVHVGDLSPLKTLTGLKILIFDFIYAPDQGHNGCPDLDFMAGMKDLEIFSAHNAGIEDITALGNLTELWSVFIDGNNITDITPLANLKNLKELLLAGNPIKDFSPIRDIYPQLEGKDFEIG